ARPVRGAARAYARPAGAGRFRTPASWWPPPGKTDARGWLQTHERPPGLPLPGGRFVQSDDPHTV
ncbi:MAG: hypothetical protein AVDCRST_MAG89-5027, partial [uncultured Gemmatimonadetes bacterium]